MAVRFTAAFAIRRGFVPSPPSWTWFEDCLGLSPYSEHLELATNVGPPLFGGVETMLKARAEIVMETVGWPLHEKITMAMETLGTEPMYQFLHLIWPDRFTRDVHDVTCRLCLSSPRDVSRLIDITVLSARELDRILLEGILENVDTARDMDPRLPTRRIMATHVQSLLEGPNARGVLRALGALFYSIGDDNALELLYSTWGGL